MSRFKYNSTSGALIPIAGYGPSLCVLTSSTYTTQDSIDTFTLTSAEISSTSTFEIYCDVPLVTPTEITQSGTSLMLSFNSSDNVSSVKVIVK